MTTASTACCLFHSQLRLSPRHANTSHGGSLRVVILQHKHTTKGSTKALNSWTADSIPLESFHLFHIKSFPKTRGVSNTVSSVAGGIHFLHRLQVTRTKHREA